MVASQRSPWGGRRHDQGPTYYPAFRLREDIMAWITGILSQNGSSSFTWNVSGPTLGIFDTITVGRLAGSSRIQIESIVANGTVYAVRVRVIDSGAVSYRIRGGPVP